MSNSFEFTPVPAFEMLSTLYFPEKAREIYESMSQEEKQTTNKIMELCRTQKDVSATTKSETPRLIVIKEISITPKISTLFNYLGYTSQIIDELAAFGVSNQLLILSW